MKLKKEKEAMAEKVEMDIRRIRIIIRGWRERLHKRLEENTAAIWGRWSKQVAKLQLLCADAENQKKAGDFFYKMDQESIITIREELTEDFEVVV